MSSRSKGRRTTAKAFDWFKENGYIVDEVEQKGRFRKYKDFLAGYCLNCWERQEECCDDPERFDGFDMIALKLPVTVLVQLKTNQPVTQAPMKKFASSFASSNVQVWCMCWYDYDGWRIQNYKNDGSIEENDLRKSKQK